MAVISDGHLLLTGVTILLICLIGSKGDPCRISISMVSGTFPFSRERRGIR